MTPQVISLSAAGSTAWIPVDYKQNPFYINLALVLSDTPSLTCKVEYTLDNIFDSSITPTAFTHTGLSSVSTNTTGSITYPVRAIRLTVSSWTSGTVTLTALQGVTNPQIYTTTGSGSLVYKFSNWPSNTGFLLASLVASSTASRTSNIVTTTATAHGITTGTSFVGYRFYYPGSPSLAAGWYDSILTIPDANTITFSAIGADFTSESINSGAAWLSNTEIVTTVLPGNTLRDGSSVTLVAARDAGLTVASKNIQLLFDGAIAGINYASSTPKEIYRTSFVCVGNNKQFVTQAPSDCVFSTNLYTSAKDITADNIVKIRGSVSVAGDFLVLNHAHLEIVQ